MKVDLSSERVKARDHVSLTCHVKVDPHLEPTVTWFRQDEEVDFEDPNYILARSGESCGRVGVGVGVSRLMDTLFDQYYFTS